MFFFTFIKEKNFKTKLLFLALLEQKNTLKVLFSKYDVKHKMFKCKKSNSTHIFILYNKVFDLRVKHKQG